MKIGNRIKKLRLQQRVTLEGLSKKTGLTTSFLSQLERDLSSPSVSSLEKIAGALNVKVGYFFEKEEGDGLIFVKKGMGKKVSGSRISCETLASGFLNIKMRPQLFTLKPKAELKDELSRFEGEEFGMVLKGRIEFLYDKQKLTFEEGDSIYCAYTQKPQKIRNIGQAEAKLLWIVFVSA
ncbi:MAG: XRE family transcriptional regulator [Candidatus Omnitrophica bacterium]|nr:XRE family transcriptional regulator [Candidatus Omnitrophota bacterium]